MKEQHEMLDAKKIIDVMSIKNRLYLSGMDIFKTIDSTNSYLLREGKEQGKQGQTGWVCLAEQQTGGRGRQGKEWFSPAGNLYCSLTWSFPFSSHFSALSLACGALLIEMLTQLGIKQGLGLKWPNDILFSNRKLAGILLENVITAQQNWVVVGLGLNIHFQEKIDPDWIDLTEILGKQFSRNKLAGLLLDTLFTGLKRFESQGLKSFLETVRRYDLLAQKEVVVETPQGKISGRAQGLNENGELLIVDDEGREHRFCYGEVSVRQKM